MNKVEMTIWGRKFNLEIVYDCYEDEQIIETQHQAVKLFLSSEISIVDSLSKAKNYCISKNYKEIGKTIDNIFKYLIPKYLYVPRNETKRVIAIMCNYKFDPENGVAIVFENEKFSKIDSQEIIL